VRNHVAPLIAFFAGAGVGAAPAAPGGYDLIFANILANPLIEMAGDIRDASAPGGRVILSGLLRTQERLVMTHYRARGFVREASIPIDEWQTLLLRRPD